MNPYQLIENEFNKNNFSNIDFHTLFESFIKNHNTIKDKNKIQFSETFENNLFIANLFSFLRKNDDFNFSHIDKETSQTLLINSNSSGILEHSLKFIYQYDSNKKHTTFFLHYNNVNYEEKISFCNNLKTNVILKFNDYSKLEISIKTNIEEKSKTHITQIPDENIPIFQNMNTFIHLKNSPFNPFANKLDIENKTKLDSFLKTIADSIIKNHPLKDTFDLLSIQYDFLNDEFKDRVIYNFSTKSKIDFHNKLISNLRDLTIIKKNGLKLYINQKF